jgi:hypothetical protein
MNKIHIITPVKNSIVLTLETIKAVMQSEIKHQFTYTVYNDFSTEENTIILEKASKEMGFELVNISDLTDQPSPNYLLILQTAQEKALKENAGVLIIESDVIVGKETIQKLIDGAENCKNCGIAASVTVDENGVINYPYLFAKGKENRIIESDKHLSFCCSLLMPKLLNRYSFHSLNPEKSWFDVTISHQSLKSGLKNYIFTNLPVLHRPHSSRPWKKLKYTNPLKYYWLKLIHKKDRI